MFLLFAVNSGLYLDTISKDEFNNEFRITKLCIKLPSSSFGFFEKLTDTLNC